VVAFASPAQAVTDIMWWHAMSGELGRQLDKLAADFHAEVVSSDQVKMRDLPPALQRLMLPMQVGQATPPFGTVEEGVRVLVICGRDEPQSSAPTYDDVYNQLNEERVNSRAQRYLRDLRRDAVIEFR